MDKNSKIIYYVPVGENSMYGLNDKIITEIKKIQENNKVRMLLFGSRARGNYKENSDIDIERERQRERKEKTVMCLSEVRITG